jgi:hypothetical protein
MDPSDNIADKDLLLRVASACEKSGYPDLAWKFVDYLIYQMDLWADRQKKYGPDNIATFGELGCLVRCSDKIARLRRSLVTHPGTDFNDETVEDAWMDLVNYAIMALMCRHGDWPNALKTV